MPEPVTHGDVADATDPRGAFAYEAPTAEGWSTNTVATPPAVGKKSKKANNGSNEAPTES